MARRKVSTLASIIFDNQQRLVVALEGSGGVTQMGGMKTDNHGGRRRSCPRTRISRQNNRRRHSTPLHCSCRHQRLTVAGLAAGVVL